RSKNFFALGVVSWMYSRPVDPVYDWINQRFANKEMVRDANLAAFKAGFNFGETAELFQHAFEVAPAVLPKGRYRNITGNVALSYGMLAASRQSGLDLFLGSYPITPASDILHELSKHKSFGVRTMQAEDEISGVGAALGAAFSGQLANAAEPWRIPDPADLPDLRVPFATEPNHDGDFWPYLRDPETLARPWAIPGTPGLMHRIGGIEKEDGTGNISYDPDNHEKMVRLRAAKVAGIAKDIPALEVDSVEGSCVLVLSWGGTWGVTHAGVYRARA